MLADWLQEFDLNLRERHLNGRDLPGNVFCHMTTRGQKHGQETQAQHAVSCSFLRYIRKRRLCKFHVSKAHFVHAMTLRQASDQFFEGKSPATVCAHVSWNRCACPSGMRASPKSLRKPASSARCSLTSRKTSALTVSLAVRPSMVTSVTADGIWDHRTSIGDGSH